MSSSLEGSALSAFRVLAAMDNLYPVSNHVGIPRFLRLAEAGKKETTALNKFQMVEQALKDEIKLAKKDMAEAKQAKECEAPQKEFDAHSY